MCTFYVYVVTLCLTYVSCSTTSSLYEQGSKFTFPETFAECTDIIINENTPKYVVQAVQNRCLDRFISIDHTHSWAKNLTSDEQSYIKSVFRKVINDAAQLNKLRHKRDVGIFPRRLRREVRAAPYQHWQNYARNVRRLKYETITHNGRSKYDVLADIHAIAINSAHFGPNFLPWHRLYLILLESALGTPIPYWDSAIDYEMEIPVQSILWTSRYFGNGYGMVTTGPFANFETPLGRLFRNIGSDGSLFNRPGINMLLSKLRLQQISEPMADENASVEGQHNGVHNWVDGVMNNLESSPHDPVFFCHHAFVDYIWELFRKQQLTRGIDPATDTFEQPANVTFQAITEVAVGLRGYYNNDGYSNKIADMVKYEPHPQCPICASSQDLYCDGRKRVCVSRRRDPREYAGQPEEAMDMAMNNGMMNNGQNTNPFPFYDRDMRVRMDSVTLNYNNMRMTGSMNGRSRMMTMMRNMNRDGTNSRMALPQMITNGNGQSESSGRMNMPAMMNVDTNVRMDRPQIMTNGDQNYDVSNRINGPEIMHVDTNVMANSFMPMNLHHEHRITSNIRTNQLVNPFISQIQNHRMSLGPGAVTDLVPGLTVEGSGPNINFQQPIGFRGHVPEIKMPTY
ncbi:tyrosinase-like protein 1 [Mytilus californianus]|uniref:tyrosinase-like protein 1 n=1 Tax=Mytilus californianus TaxID=6549 RepID=UPI0022479E90|nr:tyrosinase-like protein 1 [Mytilus californianus]